MNETLRPDYAVLIFGDRGYGRRSSNHSEAGLHRDAETATAYLTGARGVASENIVLFGESL